MLLSINYYAPFKSRSKIFLSLAFVHGHLRRSDIFQIDKIMYLQQTKLVQSLIASLSTSVYVFGLNDIVVHGYT